MWMSRMIDIGRPPDDVMSQRLAGVLVLRAIQARSLAFERERPLTPLASDEVDEGSALAEEAL